MQAREARDNVKNVSPRQVLSKRLAPGSCASISQLLALRERLGRKGIPPPLPLLLHLCLEASMG